MFFFLVFLLNSTDDPKAAKNSVNVCNELKNQTYNGSDNDDDGDDKNDQSTKRQHTSIDHFSPAFSDCSYFIDKQQHAATLWAF